MPLQEVGKAKPSVEKTNSPVFFTLRNLETVNRPVGSTDPLVGFVLQASETILQAVFLSLCSVR